MSVNEQETVCADCGKPLSEEDRRSTAPTLCDSCETGRGYDAASGPLAGMDAAVGNGGWGIQDRQTGEWVVDGYGSEAAAWIAYLERRLEPRPVAGRRYLYFRFDVTGLEEAEIDRLEMEAAVQAEASDSDDDNPGHPGVQVEAWRAAPLEPPAAAGNARSRDGASGAPRDGASEAALPDAAFLAEVDRAWWELMQGDLMLESGDDEQTAALVLAMRDNARSTIAAMAGVEQYDGKGEVITGPVTDQELARRCAAAVAMLNYGGE